MAKNLLLLAPKLTKEEVIWVATLNPHYSGWLDKDGFVNPATIVLFRADEVLEHIKGRINLISRGSRQNSMYLGMYWSNKDQFGFHLLNLRKKLEEYLQC